MGCVFIICKIIVWNGNNLQLRDCSPCAPPPCDCSVPECDQSDRCKEECAPPPCDCSIPECDQEERCKEECKPKEPECKWSNWSPFCSCSASCDEGKNHFKKLHFRNSNFQKWTSFEIIILGTQRRTRNCYCGPDFDEPETDLPRPGCEGDSVEEEPCNNGPCGKLFWIFFKRQIMCIIGSKTIKIYF